MGHVNFRLDPEDHARLAGIAAQLGVSLSELIKMMVADAEPKYAARAAETADAGDSEFGVFVRTVNDLPYPNDSDRWRESARTIAGMHVASRTAGMPADARRKVIRTWAKKWAASLPGLDAKDVEAAATGQIAAAETLSRIKGG